MFEIGNSLREARLRQHLDFNDVEQLTKVRGKYLRALEEEQFEILPAQTYVRGFLRAYAESLGLDGQLYVDEYNSRFAVEDEHLVRPRRSAAGRQRPRQHRRMEAKMLSVALVAIGIVTALVIAAWKFGGVAEQQGIPNLARSDEAPTGARDRARARAAAPAAAKARFVVRAVGGNSWIEVHAGSATGRLLYAGTLERGQTQRFVGKRFWINAGVPENLVLAVNGRTVRIGGGKPRVLVVTARSIRPVGAGA